MNQKTEKPTAPTLKSQFNKIGLVDSQIAQIEKWLTSEKKATVLEAKNCGVLRSILLEYKIAMKEEQDRKNKETAPKKD